MKNLYIIQPYEVGSKSSKSLTKNTGITVNAIRLRNGDIVFDLELHLYEMHRSELLSKLLFKDKGYSMDIEYVIHAIKTKERQLEQIRAIQATAQAVATDMKRLIKPTTIDENECIDEPQHRGGYFSHDRVSVVIGGSS